MNKSSLMSLAWKIYRKMFAGSKPKNVRKAFATALKSAWMTVKTSAASFVAMAANDAQVASTKLW